MDSNHVIPAGLEQLLSVDELAAYLGAPPKTLYSWRDRGLRPAAIKVGRYLKYPVSSVRAWLDAQAAREQEPCG